MSQGQIGISTAAVHLGRLQERGYVSSETLPIPEDALLGMPARRKFKLTEGGRKMWLAHQNTATGGWGTPDLNLA